MTPRLRRAGGLGPLIARSRRALPVILMAALGVLALAKLGLLAADALRLARAEPAPALEATSLETPMPAAGPDAPPPAPAQETAFEPALEPASGPGPAASASRPVPAAAPDQGFDPSRLGASEVAVLQQLAARRTALDQRARDLDRRAALLETAAAGLDRQIAQLTELRTGIAAMIEQHDAAEEAKLKSLVKIYETMKAKAAAEIFDRLEMPVVLRVVEGMREAKAADVLARMDPTRAKQVTTELARRTKLLEDAGAGVASAPTASGGR